MKTHYPPLQLSNKVQSIPEALSVYMNNVVYEMKRRLSEERNELNQLNERDDKTDGENRKCEENKNSNNEIHVLSLGEAYFDIPMFPFECIDFRKGYHYSESRGLYDLRQIIAKYYEKHYSAPINPDTELIISAGSKPLIYMAFQSILNPGDEVLIHEPAWLSYPEQIKLADGEPQFIPYDCPVEQFEKYFTNRTKMLVVCNPNNPAGKMYTREELEYLYSVCRPRGIYILADEAYSDFVVDSDVVADEFSDNSSANPSTATLTISTRLATSFVSMANIVPNKEGIIVVNSLSKNMGISGWRVGYVISSQDVIYNILKLNQHLITCPSTLLLLYLAKYFDDILKITLPQAQEVVRKRAEIEEYCRTIGLTPIHGSATFYLFINIGMYKYSSLDLALYLLTKYRISVVPGLAYGKSTERFIRIGVGAESIDDIKKSMDKVKEVISNNEFDSEFVDKALADLGMNRFAAQNDDSQTVHQTVQKSDCCDRSNLRNIDQGNQEDQAEYYRLEGTI